MNAPYSPQPPLQAGPIPTAKPRWTYVFVAINAIVFLAMVLIGVAQGGLGMAVFMGRPDANQILVDFGANYAPLVVAGEYWRLFTANFIHIGIVHLLFNMYALYALGRQVETLYGHRRFITIFLLSGLSGAVFSYVFTRGLSAGASTSLFGLFGALVVYFYKHREWLGNVGRQQLINLGMILFINVLIGVSPGSNIDNWGHAGGFFGGAILAWFLCPRYEPVDPFRRAFEPAVTQERRPELSNGVLMDANSLGKQAFPVALFAASLAIITIVATVSSSGLP
jgi:rhomboid protease GluP